jgi:hypothetical protein
MTALFAHLGHWYVGLPVYLSPVLAVVALLKLSEWRHRRRERREGESESASDRRPSGRAPRG